MTSLPLILDDEPLGIIMRAGAPVLRPSKILAYCWFAESDPEADENRG